MLPIISKSAGNCTCKASDLFVYLYLLHWPGYLFKAVSLAVWLLGFTVMFGVFLLPNVRMLPVFGNDDSNCYWVTHSKTPLPFKLDFTCIPWGCDLFNQCKLSAHSVVVKPGVHYWLQAVTEWAQFSCVSESKIALQQIAHYWSLCVCVSVSPKLNSGVSS